ncbi:MULTISPECIES: cytochrome bc1 complex Rieske iron-sulfur subunit [Dietzia]|uniref:cytochrome bc1 complex Rieske iron-sulfur subunit n=1 Tax=Dietzia TaxID=37914 RepID=UPI0015FC1F8C|nr:MULTISPECIES: ubiquinol-cytochrome c reductase iron-sulfur subunit [Dietzia]MBB1034716.1 ubiquinol-cytochrome c reductase iron-sulfur subunit [Dietzia sp. CQ4]MBB1036755.1 ubiquinol-cytochrome c reductase iron-sulfur subunit [Dietzia natronolimnaea]MCT1517027.1 ubiquinol-cytochrome c reductase iron-sulfur subunit [Dietzia cercidiphylli]
MSETPKNPSPADLDRMSDAELVRLGTELDEVDVRFRENRWPDGVTTRSEKRAARVVTTWFALSAVLALAFAVIYIAWPWEYRGQGEDGYWLYMVYTPLLGLTIGLSILFLGFGAVQFTKKFIPEEISVQTRHDGPSEDIDRRTIVAGLNDSWKTSTLGRRKVMGGFLGASVALIGLSAILPLGGMVKNPWRRGELTIAGDGTLHTTGWTLASDTRPDGLPAEKVYLGRDTGKVYPDGHPPAGEGRLERIHVEDLAAGGLESVFPLPASALGDFEEHMHSIHGVRNSVMLIRFRPADAARVIKRKGQENFNYGDLYAYSKICTHLACPTSLYEQQTHRFLCPCHQSQFDALEYAKPVFGPAARALPQLPIAVDNEGYLVANGDFIEPVGPAFWERRS